jgi:hypothetical protein
MKKTIKYIFGAVLGLSLSSVAVSCVDDIRFGDAFLEKAPGVDVDINTIFSKKENTEYFLWNLYGQIYNPWAQRNRANQCPVEANTDLFQDYSSWGGSAMSYYNGSLQPGDGYTAFPFTDTYGGDGLRPGIWGAVRHAWILIENLDNVPDMTEDEKSHIRAEAYLIMATRYFDCFRYYGGLPLIDHSITADEAASPEFDGGRKTVAETVEFIDGLLQKAIAEPGFPWRHENPDDTKTGAGRLSKSAAYAMRAKLYTFAASPLFNSAEPFYPGADETVWLGGEKPEYWQKALAACEEFFSLNQSNGGFYALVQPAGTTVTDYVEAFRQGYWDRGNSEKIIEVHSSYSTNPWGWAENADLMDCQYHGMTNPTVEYMEMFGMADGTNYLYKDVLSTTEKPNNNPDNIDIFKDRDPRLYGTLVVTLENYPYENGAVKSSSGIRPQFWQGGSFNGTDMGNYVSGSPQENANVLSGMKLWKFILDFDQVGGKPINYPYLRMADMHLMYAEALAETGKLQQACNEINKVRARVGLGRIETMNPGLNLTSNKDNLIAEIIRERACEFGQEADRMHDMSRRKLRSDYTKTLHEIVVWRKTADGQKDERADTKLTDGEAWPKFIYEKRAITKNARSWWRPGGWDDKWFLCPISRDEVNKGYGLTQNPGW